MMNKYLASLSLVLFLLLQSGCSQPYRPMKVLMSG